MRLSSRLQGLEPAATLAMAARARALERAGRPIISFTTGEPDFDTPDAAREAGIQAIREGFTRYTATAGIPELKDAIRGRIAREYGVEYGPSEVIACAGAKQALFNALMAICSPGDEVVIFSPYWTSYPEMVRVAGGVPVFAETRREAGYIPDPAALEAVLTDRTRVLLLNSPNNPTGALCDARILEGIADVLRGREVMVISDDIYNRLVYGEAGFDSYLDADPDGRSRILIVGSVSKTFAMTGWRLGYAAGPEELIAAMEVVQSHTTSNPCSISQRAAVAVLDGPDDEMERMRAEFDARRRLMVQAIGAIPDLPLVEPLGAFYVFPDFRAYFGRRFGEQEITGSVDLAEALLEGADVATVPGAAFGDDGAIRFSYALPREALEEGMTRLRRFLTETLK